jgi:hypothetical protein
METEAGRHQCLGAVLQLEGELQPCGREHEALPRPVEPRPGIGLVIVFQYQPVVAALHHLPVATPAMAVQRMPALALRRCFQDLAAAEQEAGIADAAAIGHQRKAAHIAGLAPCDGSWRGRAQPIDATAAALPPESGDSATDPRRDLATGVAAGQGHHIIADNAHAGPRDLESRQWRRFG